MKNNKIMGIGAVIAAFLIVGTALAATIDPVLRTVTTPKIFVDWDALDPERIVDVRWNGSGNLTATATNSNCPDDPELEYFGNSWASQDEGTPDFVFKSLVGWGSTGSWNAVGSNAVRIRSKSVGCFGSVGVPVVTKYKFKDDGPRANSIRVVRKFNFRAMPLAYNFRPYIPRLSPAAAYSQVLHPDAAGTTLLTDDSLACDFGCKQSDWNGTWFAIHNPTTGSGLIFSRTSTANPAVLWVDTDGASDTAASSALLLEPGGGFTRRVKERQELCFYDSALWTPSLTLPSSCR